jgi:DNA-binding NarL/FixJ family response regulator
MVHALQHILSGKNYISPAVADGSCCARQKDRPPHELLSDREYQVLCMIGAGKRSEIGGSWADFTVAYRAVF